MAKNAPLERIILRKIQLDLDKTMLTPTNQSDSLLESKLKYAVSLAEYDEAIQKIKNLEALQRESNNKIISLEEEIKRLQEQLKLMQHQRFGKKSEIQIGEPIVETQNIPMQQVASYARKREKSRG